MEQRKFKGEILTTFDFGDLGLGDGGIWEERDADDSKYRTIREKMACCGMRLVLGDVMKIVLIERTDVDHNFLVVRHACETNFTNADHAFGPVSQARLESPSSRTRRDDEKGVKSPSERVDQL